MFVSDRKIFLKNIDKSLDEGNLKQLTFESLGMTKVSKKILKKVKVYKNDENQQIKGAAHMEFVNSIDALNFIENVEKSDELWKLFNVKRVPILEFALENAQKVLKHERVLNSVKDKRNERKKVIMDDRVKGKEGVKINEEMKKKFVETKIIKKDQIENNKKIVKMRLTEIEGGTYKPTTKQVDELIDLAYGRGPRQRLRKRLVKLGIAESVNIEVGKKERSDSAKAKKDFIDKRKKTVVQNEENKSKHIEVKKEQKHKAKNLENLRKRMPEAERQIAKTIKNHKKAKGKKENTDKFDEMAENYVQKKVKTAKWFS